MTPATNVAVVLASAGRPELLGEALRTVAAQRGVGFSTVVSVPDETSLPTDVGLLDGVVVVTGTKGLAAQRNAGLAALDRPGIVAFFDDDSVLRDDWLVNAVGFFRRRPDVVALTGRVLIDGAVSGEVTPVRASDAIAASREEGFSGRWMPWKELYGCNFAVRIDKVGGELFDERLPLYSWLEDHDFARRVAAHGGLAKVYDCVIVHRAAASGGRQSHVRLGYSQVMNPMYLCGKGSFPVALTAQQVGRPVAKNVVLSLGGPQSSWRRERLRGNLLAAMDALRGHIKPERITEFQ